MAHQGTLARHEQLLELARQQAETRLHKVLPEEAWVAEEEYSHSLHLLGEVGQLDVEGKLDTPEGKVMLGSLRECFDSSVIEMLHTDREFREKLEINRERRHIIYGGEVLAHDGKTSIVSLCRNGARSAALEASEDPRMQAVADRCAADVRNAEAVDSLPIGHMRAGISNYPKEAMERYGAKFYDDLGFREGLAFIQWYYRVDANTLIAGSYSVDSSDIETWRKVWPGKIPDGLVTNHWLDCAVEMGCTEEEARKWVLAVRAQFYAEKDIHVKRYSTDEFMAINKVAADQMFGLYCELARAYHNHRKTPALHALVQGLLETPQGLSIPVRQQLTEMHQNENLTKEGASLLEQLIRYASAEHLRDGLRLLGTDSLPEVRLFVPVDANFLEFMARSSAGNILKGARAGRTYGGCTRSIDLSENPDYDSSVDPDKNPQEAYGGKGSKETQKKSAEKVCVYQHSGCYCCPYDGNGKPLPDPVKVFAKKRPGFVECMRPGCGAYMILDAKGNPKKGEGTISKGGIFRAAQERQTKEKAQRAMAARILKPVPLDGGRA